MGMESPADKSLRLIELSIIAGALSRFQGLTRESITRAAHVAKLRLATNDTEPLSLRPQFSLHHP
jgi:hypothetical protein